MRYAVVIEKADGNYSAYVPDLPGCVATGETVKAVEAELRDAIRFHIGVSRPTDCRCRRRQALRITSRLNPKPPGTAPNPATLADLAS